ncbi:MAG: hypothetical protein WCQ53_08140 [bacterium]
MKKFVVIFIITASFISINAFADNSKMTKVDIDVKSTHIVKADLDQDDFFYYIDVNACICWISRLIGGAPAIATFDCAKLAAHPRLEQYVSKCTVRQSEVKKEETSAVDKDIEAVAKEKENEAKSLKEGKSKKDLKDVKKESDKVLEQVVDGKDTKKK